MRRTALSLTLLSTLLLAVPGARAQGLDLRIGAFLPRGEGSLFQDDRSLYAVNTSDFDGVYGGAEYNQVVLKNVELGLSWDWYSETVDTFYRDYERPGGGNIQQSLRLRMSPLGLSVRFLPTSKRAKVVPYIGGGVDAIFYQYEEWGDFIDFYDPTYTIYADHFIADGTAFGLHALGGVRVYLNRDFALVGEARYQWAENDMHDDFSPNAPGLVNRLDLSGATFTFGVHVRF